MKLNVVNKLKQSFTLKFVVIFVVIFLVTTFLSTYLFSRLIYRDISSRMKIELISAKNDFMGNLKDKRNLSFHYSQFISAAEKTSLHPGSTEEVRGFELFLIEKARLLDFDVDIVEVYPGEELTDRMLRKGMTGIVSSSFAMTGKLDRQFSIVAVSPVLESENVRKLVRISYPVTRKFLIERKKVLGSDLTFLYGGIVVSTTTMCDPCLACFKRVVSERENAEALSKGKDIYFEDECEPFFHSGIITTIDIGGQDPLFLVLSKDMKNEIISYRKSLMAYSGGISAYSILMIALFVLLARRLTEPIKSLTVMAREISKGRAGVTVEQTRDDEVGELERSLNEMSGKLAEAFSLLKERKVELEKLNKDLKAANLEIIEWNKKLEERIREKTGELERIHDKMVEIEKMAAMGQLAAGMAHELNNPLAGIIGYAQYGLERTESSKPEKLDTADIEKMKSYFKTIEELATRCGTIVHNLTDFSSDKVYELDLLDLNEIIDNTLIFLEGELKEKGVIVKKELIPGIKRVYGSSEGLSHAIRNLIMNAMDAMNDGGELTISTGVEDERIRIDIIDTGEGIPKEIINKIFDPFFTTREVGKGTGLGLYVSYNIVRRHGGDISVKSEEGAGSTFTISLPLIFPRK